MSPCKDLTKMHTKKTQFLTIQTLNIFTYPKVFWCRTWAYGRGEAWRPSMSGRRTAGARDPKESVGPPRLPSSGGRTHTPHTHTSLARTRLRDTEQGPDLSRGPFSRRASAASLHPLDATPRNPPPPTHRTTTCDSLTQKTCWGSHSPGYWKLDKKCYNRIPKLLMCR